MPRWDPRPDLVDAAVEALEGRDWDALQGLLHPYVLWSDASARTRKGRKVVLAWLAERPAPGPPSSYEVRDDRIYRWFEPTD